MKVSDYPGLPHVCVRWIFELDLTYVLRRQVSRKYSQLGHDSHNSTAAQRGTRFLSLFFSRALIITVFLAGLQPANALRRWHTYY